MAIVRFSAAKDYVAGWLKAFGNNSAYIQAVVHTDSSGNEIAGVPTALGAQTGANSLSVVPASDALFNVQPHALTANRWQYAAAASGISNTTTAVTFKAADASLRNYVVAVQIMHEALGTATEIAIRDGAGGTVLWRSKIPAGVAGLRDITFPAPLKGTAATLLEVLTLTASTTGAVYFNAQGFVGA